MTIWKFEIETTDEQVVMMPADAEILCVQVQREKPCLWALVDEQAPLCGRRILTFGTGHPVGKRGRYVGTYQLHSGFLVLHVFEAA